ncbi:biotin attachment protein [Halobacterium sp. DL1]|jgi:pyruvate/2-oxoglutarate dehydrogenase complex dihydrolipoamide acyltransferase (E2) component|nr:biotin attachment protein [Halobacterium sp. DL1]
MTDVDSADVWPADAMDVEEAVVSNWFVRDGATVEAGETIAEIQIEKVSVDVTAPDSGTVERLVAEQGEFRRGDLLARIT